MDSTSEKLLSTDTSLRETGSEPAHQMSGLFFLLLPRNCHLVIFIRGHGNSHLKHRFPGSTPNLLNQTDSQGPEVYISVRYQGESFN